MTARGPPVLRFGEELVEISDRALLDVLVRQGVARDEAVRIVDALVAYAVVDGAVTTYVVLSRWVPVLTQRRLLGTAVAHVRMHLDGTFDRAGGHDEHARDLLRRLLGRGPVSARPVATAVAAAAAGAVTVAFTGAPAVALAAAGAVVVLRVARVGLARLWNRLSRGHHLATGARAGRLLSGAPRRFTGAESTFRLRTEPRLYVPIVQWVAVRIVAWALGADVAEVVNQYVSLFPHEKLQRKDGQPRVSGVHRLTLRERQLRWQIVLATMIMERAQIVGVTVPVANAQIHEIHLPGPAGDHVKWTVHGAFTVLFGGLAEDDVTLRRLVNPSRWLAAVWVSRLTSRFALRGTPAHLDLFLQIYGIEGRQVTALLAAPKIVGIRPVARFGNWVRSHDLSPRTMPGLRHLVVTQVGVGVGSEKLGNWVELRVNVVGLERQRGTGPVRFTSFVTIYEGPAYALGRAAWRAALLTAPASTRVARAGALERRAIAAKRWRIEHLRRAVLRIEAERDRQLGALQHARARRRAALEAAVESNERRATAVRAMIAERLDELAELPAADRLVALHDRQAAQLSEIEERIAAGETGRRLLRRRDALAAAVAATDGQLVELGRFVATAPERTLPHGPTPALQTPAGPLGRRLTEAERAWVTAAGERLVLERGPPEGELLLVTHDELIAALRRAGAEDPEDLADRTYAVGLVVDGRLVIVLSAAQHALLVHLGVLDEVVVHERTFHGPDARAHDESAHQDDTDQQIELIDERLAGRDDAQLRRRLARGSMRVRPGRALRRTAPVHRVTPAELPAIGTAPQEAVFRLVAGAYRETGRGQAWESLTRIVGGPVWLAALSSRLAAASLPAVVDALAGLESDGLLVRDANGTFRPSGVVAGLLARAPSGYVAALLRNPGQLLGEEAADLPTAVRAGLRTATWNAGTRRWWGRGELKRTFRSVADTSSTVEQAAGAAARLQRATARAERLAAARARRDERRRQGLAAAPALAWRTVRYGVAHAWMPARHRSTSVADLRELTRAAEETLADAQRAEREATVLAFDEATAAGFGRRAILTARDRAVLGWKRHVALLVGVATVLPGQTAGAHGLVSGAFAAHYRNQPTTSVAETGSHGTLITAFSGLGIAALGTRLIVNTLGIAAFGALGVAGLALIGVSTAPASFFPAVTMVGLMGLGGGLIRSRMDLYHPVPAELKSRREAQNESAGKLASLALPWLIAKGTSQVGLSLTMVGLAALAFGVTAAVVLALRGGHAVVAVVEPVAERPSQAGPLTRLTWQLVGTPHAVRRWLASAPVLTVVTGLTVTALGSAMVDQLVLINDPFLTPGAVGDGVSDLVLLRGGVVVLLGLGWAQMRAVFGGEGGLRSRWRGDSTVSEARLIRVVTTLPVVLIGAAAWVFVAQGLVPVVALLTASAAVAGWSRLPVNRWYESPTGASLINAAKAASAALGALVSAAVLGGYSDRVAAAVAAGADPAALTRAADLRLLLLTAAVVGLNHLFGRWFTALRIGTFDELRAALAAAGTDPATIIAKLLAAGPHDIGAVRALYLSETWRPHGFARHRLAARARLREEVGLDADELDALLAALRRFEPPASEAAPHGPQHGAAVPGHRSVHGQPPQRCAGAGAAATRRPAPDRRRGDARDDRCAADLPDGDHGVGAQGQAARPRRHRPRRSSPDPGGQIRSGAA